MTPDQLAADEHRAALALVAAAAGRDHQAATAILGRGWRTSRRGLIAWHLARWLAAMLPRLGHDDPAEAARGAIADSIAAEAEAAGGTP
jgi:hypothetical protein